MSIHRYEEAFESAKARIKKDKKISARNKELILNCISDLSLKNLSFPRLNRYMDVLKWLALGTSKDLDKLNKQDLKNYVSTIQQNKEYSPWTKQTYKVIIRKFFCWLNGIDKPGQYPEIVEWINIAMKRSEMRLPADGDLIKQEDVIKMIKGAEHPRDKAFIAMLWETGARIGEIGDLKVGTIKFDQHGATLVLHGKTGSRSVRIIWSVPYLSTWLDNHPFKDNPQAPIWIKLTTRNKIEKMKYSGLATILRRACRQGGIRKRVYPHLFRHSRATFLATHLTEFQMNQYLGWIQGSKMAATYVHMNGKNLESSILSLNGIKVEEKKENDELKPRVCPRCELVNPHDTVNCRRCGGLIDLKVAMELDEKHRQEQELRSNADKVMDMLLKDREVRSILMQKMEGLRQF